MYEHARAAGVSAGWPSLTDTYAGDRSPAARRWTIPLTQDELAELVGGTRPSVNQVLRRFVDEGMLEVSRGKIVVNDVERLRRLAGDGTPTAVPDVRHALWTRRRLKPVRSDASLCAEP